MKNAYKSLLLTPVFILFSSKTIAQLENSNWYFGQFAGLTFSTSPPTAIINSTFSSVEGCASISDINGNFLFYASAQGVYNSNHVLMANGGGLFGDGSSTQASMIVKQPGNNSLYCVFTTSAIGAYAYSIVDMSLAAGLGSVTVKNSILYSLTTEKQVAVRHCNGKDVWIVSHEINSDKFVSHRLTSSGINPSPIFSSIGGVISSTTGAGAGQLKISPDGKKLAMAVSGNSVNGGGFYLFDFNTATGIVSNSLVLYDQILNQNWAYGIEFSPDGSKLYGCTGFFNLQPELHQWNICAANNPAIIASRYTINPPGSLTYGSLQRAIDGKIYLTVSSQQSLSVINNPNLSGAAMGFSFNSLPFSTTASITARMGLPNFINPYIKPSPQPFTNTVACNQVNFSPPPLPTFSSGCSSTPYPPSGYLWDFGEPSSGTSNTSTASSPNHVYAAPGTYTVKLVLLNACTNDTLMQAVNITTMGPTPAVAGPDVICKGDRYTYTVSGGTSYLWSNGVSTSTAALQPTLTTVYTVSATANGCTQSKTFTVNVSPCLGIEDLETAGTPMAIGGKVYPNPVLNELKIESAFEGSLKVFDLSGRELHQSHLLQGENTFDTSFLNTGVYSLQLSNGTLTRHLRMVKVE
ncbi:MAG: T9SS type A sorting domain-containing protein [Bacteroidia bacterium]|jgi:PKD repeat protein|nr:T9SS type A sorting domain-containing protein [Bacteroidia bacterium]